MKTFARIATRTVSTNLAALRRHEQGAVALMFGLAALPVLLVVGGAIDFARATKVQAQLQTATDSTSLSLGQKLAAGADPATFNAQAQALLAGAAHDPSATVASVTLETHDGGNKLCVDAASRSDAAFLKLIGQPSIAVHANSCVTSGAGGLEIALVLDTSESMLDSAGGVSKLDALKTAANNFINTLYGSAASNPTLKVSIVPFSSSVAVDPALGATANWADRLAQSPYHWTGFTGTVAGISNRWDIWNQLKAKNADWFWKGCFESLPFPENTQDTTPSGANPKTLLVPMLYPDEPDSTSQTFKNNYLSDKGPNCPTATLTDAVAQARICKYSNPRVTSTTNSGPLYGCRSQPLLQMTTTKSTLTSKISSLIADGTTNIHEGVMWGWRSISPNGPFKDGAAYSASSKVIVLMTDGMNTWYDVANTLNASRYGSHGYYNTKDASGRNDRTPSTTIVGASLPKPTSDASARAVMDDLTRRTCKNARDAGVTIYTIAFSTSADPIDAEGQQLLKDCAGDDNRFFATGTASGINAAFAQIGASLSKGKLRIVN